jgi:hypothetical protein
MTTLTIDHVDELLEHRLQELAQERNTSMGELALDLFREATGVPAPPTLTPDEPVIEDDANKLIRAKTDEYRVVMREAPTFDAIDWP